mmetsp:Transcript_24755/g.69336  ORF Transcript_24755/g.69336 Transcript_24755/m.69336 type:complete len:201 (-) Transcript_24755:781-1383(-)
MPRPTTREKSSSSWKCRAFWRCSAPTQPCRTTSGYGRTWTSSNGSRRCPCGKTTASWPPTRGRPCSTSCRGTPAAPLPCSGTASTSCCPSHSSTWRWRRANPLRASGGGRQLPPRPTSPTRTSSSSTAWGAALSTPGGTCTARGTTRPRRCRCPAAGPARGCRATCPKRGCCPWATRPSCRSGKASPWGSRSRPGSSWRS